jgi:hypothetical protein
MKNLDLANPLEDFPGIEVRYRIPILLDDPVGTDQ